MSMFSISTRVDVEQEYADDIRSARKRYHLIKTMQEDIEAFENNHPDLPVKLELGWKYPSRISVAFLKGESENRYCGKPAMVMLEIEVPRFDWEMDRFIERKYGMKRDEFRKTEHPALLGDVMSAFQCIFKDAEPEWTEKDYASSTPPQSVYYGIGIINGHRYGIRFKAPWPPRGCEIITKRTWSKKTILTCAGGA